MLLLIKYTVLYKENEICCIILQGRYSVAPFAGAWIEIIEKQNTDDPDTSLPSRERGLKLWHMGRLSMTQSVAPFAGAWIEILFR